MTTPVDELIGLEGELRGIKECAEADNEQVAHITLAQVKPILAAIHYLKTSPAIPVKGDDVPLFIPKQTEAMVITVAKALCLHDGYDPDRIEPGDALGIDGHTVKGEVGHFMWRQFVEPARAAIAALTQPQE